MMGGVICQDGGGQEGLGGGVGGGVGGVREAAFDGERDDFQATGRRRGEVEDFVIISAAFLPGLVPLGGGAGGEAGVDFARIGDTEVVGEGSGRAVIGDAASGEDEHAVIEFQAVEAVGDGDNGAAGVAGEVVEEVDDFRGAAGVEVALAIWRRLNAAGRKAEVTLVDRTAELLSDYTPAVRQTVARLFAKRGIHTRTGRAVTAVATDSVVLDTGEVVPSALTIWLTGAVPTALTADSALPKDERGFWLVDETLRSVGGAHVWGAGDCIAIRGHPSMSKAGVYAVRQGPVLAANLRTAAERGSTVSDARYMRYVPQRHFLAILNTADDCALLRWRGVTAHARWAWWLKDVIDRRFMAKYGVEATDGAVQAAALQRETRPTAARFEERAP